MRLLLELEGGLTTAHATDPERGCWPGCSDASQRSIARDCASVRAASRPRWRLKLRGPVDQSKQCSEMKHSASNAAPMLRERGHASDTSGTGCRGERHERRGGAPTLVWRVVAVVALLVSLDQAVAFLSPAGPPMRPRWSPDAGRSMNWAARRGLRPQPAHAGSITCYEFRSAESYVRASMLKECVGQLSAPFAQQEWPVAQQTRAVGSWRPKTLPRTLRQSYGNEQGEHQSTATLLRGRESSTTLLRGGVLVGHGIRSRNRVAVGHGISSRSHMATLGQVYTDFSNSSHFAQCAIGMCRVDGVWL